MRGRHNAALLDCIIEHGKRRRGTVGAATGKSHIFKNACHTVALRGSRCKRQVNDAVRGIEAVGCLVSDELTHTGDLEGDLLYGVRQGTEIAIARLLNGIGNHSGARNAHVNNGIGLTHTVHSARHKGVVLGNVGKDHKLRASDGVLVTGKVSGLGDRLAHELDRIHVDTRLGGSHIDRRAHTRSGGQRLGDGGNEVFRAKGHSLLYKGTEAADKVDSEGIRRSLKRMRQTNVPIAINSTAHKRNGGNRNALVDNRHTVACLQFLANADKALRLLCDLVVNFGLQTTDVLADAIEQRDTHGNGTDIEIFLPYHMYGFKNICCIEHEPFLSVF